MKILVIQLARLGDIYQTWPTLKAIKRQYPNCDLHFLVREKFSAACAGLNCVDKKWELSSAAVLEPVLIDQMDIEESLTRMGDVVECLREQVYDRVINLSFSPFSSNIVDYISTPLTQVSGYTRFSDGFLQIPDDASAFFYAQVGVTTFNRIHLTDIFPVVAEVEMLAEDFIQPIDSGKVLNKFNLVPKKYIVIHISASKHYKSLTAFKWKQVIRKIFKESECQILLVGSEGERLLSEEILSGEIYSDLVCNLVGETLLGELFGIIQEARLVLGGDSVCSHICSLVNTQMLNISFACVKFWETGPRSEGSRILWSSNEDLMPSDRIVKEAVAMLNGKISGQPIINYKANSSLESYKITGYAENDFCWKLIQALYMEADYPECHDKDILLGMLRLREAAQLALTQIESLRIDNKNKTVLKVLENVDSLLEAIQNIQPQLQPMISWFQTERLRIGPAGIDEVIDRTEKIFKDFQVILNVYLGAEKSITQGEKDVRGTMVEK